MQKSKMFGFILSLILVIGFDSGCSISGAKGEAKDLADTDCQAGLVTVESVTNSPVQLSIREAKCTDFYTNTKLMLKNVGDKPITGYEISSIQDYGNGRGIKLATSVTGDSVILNSNETKEIVTDGGFAGGASYEKSAGKLRRVVIRVSFVDFDDGTRWTQENLTE